MKHILSAALVLSALCLVPACRVSADEITTNAVYLGVVGYGDSSVNVQTKPDFQYRFYADGEVKTWKIDNGEPSHDSVWTYDLQNLLQEGYLFRVTVTDGTVTALAPLDGTDTLVSGVIGKIGKKSINISSRVYKMVEDCPVRRIIWAPGGSRVEEDLALPGKTVRALLNQDGAVEALFLSPVSINRVLPVRGTPGTKTLKNFLATAFMPVGTTLYVFGGGWNWQDTGSSRLVTTIGLPESWVDFFQAQSLNYTFKSTDYAEGDNPLNTDPRHSYYPYNGWNEYYYAGVDCSAYIAWTVYNTLYKKDGREGLLKNSRNLAKSFADKKWGTITNVVNKPTSREDSEYRVGDIFSINGHVWICVGTCSDGSLVILHSTPSLSYTNLPGGGPQLGAIGDSTGCEAWKLADRYMSTWYPDWNRRYPTTLKDYESMTDVTEENTGKFSWELGKGGVLTDPDGYANMPVEDILRDLFGE